LDWEGVAEITRSDRGALLMSHETYYQNGEMVLSCECAHFLRRQPERA
jgi:hypothetical protein